MSPSESVITSPGTRHVLSISQSAPSLRHLTMHAESFLRFSIALSARYCCTVPTTALSRIMKSIIKVSVRSALSPEMNAITAVTAAAAMSSSVITSLNWPINSLKKPVRPSRPSEFVPKRCSLSPASCPLMPMGEEFRRDSTCPALPT